MVALVLGSDASAALSAPMMADNVAEKKTGIGY